MYDYLIVGAGLFGAVFAHEAKKHGKSCLVVEKRNHIAGNIYCKNVDGIRKLLVEIFVQHIAGLIFQDVFIIKALSGSELQKQLLRVVQGVDVDELKFVCGEEQFLKGTVQFRRVQPEHF